MATPQNIRIANDNAPEQVAAAQFLPGSKYFLAQKSQSAAKIAPSSPNIPDLLQSAHGKPEEAPTSSLNITVGLWAGALTFMAVAFLLGFGTDFKVFASLALLWTGIWSSYVSSDHGYWRLSEISVVTALAGLMGAITASVNYFGLGLTLADGLMLMSISPLIIGYLLKSRICVLASICASLIWGALNFSGLIGSSSFILILPLVLGAQIFVGTKIRSGLAITLAVITAYYWIANVLLSSWTAGNLPLTFAATALFIIGAAHHRSGKAIEDKLITGSSVHIHAGWIAAIIGAICFQYFWLNPDAVQSSSATLSASGLAIWKSVTIGSLFIIFCSGIIRYKHAQMSLPGIFLLTAAAAIIPMMLWFPGWPQMIRTTLPGVSVMPAIGVLIGSAITASSLGMAINGVRRHSPIMMGLGILGLLVQAYLMLEPKFFSLDNIILFLCGFSASLTIGALIAGSSLSHQAQAPRLKHA